MAAILLIKPIRFAEIIGAPNAAALFAEYAAECSIPEIGPINPQAEIYTRLEAAGVMQCFGAFDGADLIGFACVLATINPHYGLPVATFESLFIASAHRKGGDGLRLIDAVKDYARKIGCVGLLYTAVVGGKLDRLLKAKRIPQTHKVYCEKLK